MCTAHLPAENQRFLCVEARVRVRVDEEDSEMC